MDAGDRGLRLADAVRDALLRVAYDAWEVATMRAPRPKGRFEAAVGAPRLADVRALVAGLPETPSRG